MPTPPMPGFAQAAKAPEAVDLNAPVEHAPQQQEIYSMVRDAKGQEYPYRMIVGADVPDEQFLTQHLAKQGLTFVKSLDPEAFPELPRPTEEHSGLPAENAGMRELNRPRGGAGREYGSSEWPAWIGATMGSVVGSRLPGRGMSHLGAGVGAVAGEGLDIAIQKMRGEPVSAGEIGKRLVARGGEAMVSDVAGDKMGKALGRVVSPHLGRLGGAVERWTEAVKKGIQIDAASLTGHPVLQQFRSLAGHTPWSVGSYTQFGRRQAQQATDAVLKEVATLGKKAGVAGLEHLDDTGRGKFIEASARKFSRNMRSFLGQMRKDSPDEFTSMSRWLEDEGFNANKLMKKAGVLEYIARDPEAMGQLTQKLGKQNLNFADSIPEMKAAWWLREITNATETQGATKGLLDPTKIANSFEKLGALGQQRVFGAQVPYIRQFMDVLAATQPARFAATGAHEQFPYTVAGSIAGPIMAAAYLMGQDHTHPFVGLVAGTSAAIVAPMVMSRLLTSEAGTKWLISAVQQSQHGSPFHKALLSGAEQTLDGFVRFGAQGMGLAFGDLVVPGNNSDHPDAPQGLSLAPPSAPTMFDGPFMPKRPELLH